MALPHSPLLPPPVNAAFLNCVLPYPTICYAAPKRNECLTPSSFFLKSGRTDGTVYNERDERWLDISMGDENGVGKKKEKEADVS